jgi:hypothetical protein
MKTIKTKLLFLTLLQLLVFSTINAQNELEHQAPTMQVGLNGITFSRGALDAQLIMTMIAEKQKEVGIQAVQNMFLSKMESAGGAFYSFSDNVIRGVVTEKDPDIIIKKILENTTNIAFTYAFTDYYLKLLNQTTGNLPTCKVHFDDLTLRMSLPILLNSQFQKGLIGVRSATQNATLGETNYEDKNATNMIALLIDMASEAIRNNKTLKELGVLQVSYSQSYDFKNQYLKLRRENSPLAQSADLVYNDLVANLQQFTDIIGLINYHKNSNTFRSNSGASISNLISLDSIRKSNIQLNVQLNTISTQLTLAYERMQVLLRSTSDTGTKDKLIGDLKKLAKYIAYVKKASDYTLSYPLQSIKNNGRYQLIIYSDIVYTTTTEIIPALNEISIWDANLLVLSYDLEATARQIFQYYLRDASCSLNNPWVVNNMENFMSILSKVYEFDKARTFSSSVAILADIEKVFPNDKIKSSLAFINTYVRDFVKIVKDEKGVEYIDINIESFLVKMSQIKSDKLKRTSLLFTVGTNSITFDQTVILPNNVKLKNYSFVSEKIGLKIKLIDWDFWKSRNPGETYSISCLEYTKNTAPKSPLVSNWYMSLYGSGILYNIISTGTVKDYNNPIVGISTGISFFNSLDFSICFGAPIPQNSPFATFSDQKPFFTLNNKFYGFSFDIPIGEYLERANQNRKDNQNKKILAKINQN